MQVLGPESHDQSTPSVFQRVMVSLQLGSIPLLRPDEYSITLLQYETHVIEEVEHVDYQITNANPPVIAKLGKSMHQWMGSAICEAQCPLCGRRMEEPVTSARTEMWWTPARQPICMQVTCAVAKRGHSQMQHFSNGFAILD